MPLRSIVGSKVPSAPVTGVSPCPMTTGTPPSTDTYSSRHSTRFSSPTAPAIVTGAVMVAPSSSPVKLAVGGVLSGGGGARISSPVICE
jgi:hypothetical protein